MLKAKIPSLVRPGDTLTMIWFSGRGEVGTICEGVALASLADLTVIHAAIDAGLRSRGLTGFCDPLIEVERAIGRLRVQADRPIALFFMTDGMDNQSKRSQILDVVARVAPLLASSTFVEYGDFADRATLAAMAEVLRAVNWVVVSSANSAAVRSVASHNSRRGRVKVEFAGFWTRARARAGKEYLSRRCCRKVSADRSRIQFPPLTLLLEYNSRQLQQKTFALDIFSSKNIIVAQINERPGHGGPDVYFQINRSVW